MALADLVQDRIDAAAAQAQRLAQQVPPLSDAVMVPIDVLQMIFAALFALLHRLGPHVVKAIILLNSLTIRAPIAAILNDTAMLDAPQDSFHRNPGQNGPPAVRNMASHGDFPSTPARNWTTCTSLVTNLRRYCEEATWLLHAILGYRGRKPSTPMACAASRST